MNDTTKNRHRKKRYRQKAQEMRKTMRQEIDAIRTKVRAAYTLEAQINVCNYKPTEEELELISERSFNTKLLEKLEAIYFDTNKTTDTPRSVDNRLYRENLVMLHFFYLVRLAQQGFLYMISGAYPDLEPEAVIYLCDKMVGASVYAEKYQHKSDKNDFKRVAYRLMRDLVEEKDEPVAEGFKTTFKQIVDVIQSLIFQASDREQQSNTTTIPPIWVVMPNVSMLDNKTFAVPGAVPTLPFPESMLPAFSSAHNTFPSAANELKKQADLLEEKRKAATAEDAANRQAKKEKDAKVLAAKELAAKELATKQINGNAEEEHTEEEEDEDSDEDDDYEDEEDNEEFSDHYYEDRFADADTSDEEELLTQSSVKAVELTKSVSQASQLSNSQASQISNSQASHVSNSQASHVSNSQASHVSNSQASQISNGQASQTSNGQASQTSNGQASQTSNGQASQTLNAQTVQSPNIQDKTVSNSQAGQSPVIKTSQTSATPEVPKANTSWLNFAAASPEVETHSGPTSPRNNNRGNKPYHVNPRY
ncbi:uncharacterized protein EV154DRAFT_557191 [Mucor mucedo]|uniref:uncharacterized protein n=1 Tax=Mucor mucedo TaxID=29922 RepID=UPI00221F9766|nr:uncharacterized protein EV154DRAFT_557191 [Mucor mucedo]KAI7865743.1 hypothetical protein EV154DRAFT_557191 [Mucor mucedo]